MREDWVINARTLETRVHREPPAAGYSRVAEVPASDRLLPQAAPELAISLGGLDID